MPIDPQFQNAHALVIDANGTLRKAVVAQLRELGVQRIHQCKGLIDSRQCLERVAFDFVLCADLIDGSELTGQSLLEELRREAVLPHSTVFVMMAGEATYAQVVEAAEAALDCFLLRPFRLSALAERLAVARRRKQEMGDILAALDSGDHEKALAACLARYHANLPFGLHCARIAAEILLRTDRLAEALALYRQVDQAQQQPAWAQLGAARCMFATGDLAGANAEITGLLLRLPSLADGHDVLGRVQLEQGELTAALKTLRTAAEITPGCSLRQQQCGTLAFFMGDNPLATRMLERTVAQGLGSRLFDALSLVLLALLRHDSGDTRRLATVVSQMREYRKGYPDSMRLKRFEATVDTLRVLLARQLDEARAQILALADDMTSEDFDLEAANLVLAMWSRLPERDIAAGQQERLVRGLGMRFCVSKAVTEILIASAQRSSGISGILRTCHGLISEIADEAHALAKQGQPAQAIRLLLTQGAATRNAHLIDLASHLLRRHDAGLPDAAALRDEIDPLQAQFCRPITHLAGIRRSGRAPGGLLLRGQQLGRPYETSKAVYPNVPLAPEVAQPAPPAAQAESQPA